MHGMVAMSGGMILRRNHIRFARQVDVFTRRRGARGEGKTRLLVPVSRFPTVVRDREYRNAVRKSDENDVVGEIANRELTHCGVFSARGESSAPRKLLQKIECSRDFLRESMGRVFIPLA